MIETIHVEGFQSLKDVTIGLGRFTVLVGPSNSGKSAIRRALEAVIRNDPPAGRMRVGENRIVTSIALDSGEVSWEKRSRTTRYVLTKPGEEPVEVAKPGSTCPPAILEALKLTDINFASQFDQPYLLAETPSAAARALGDLTNISVLFEGIREATRRQRAAGQKAKTLDEQIVALEGRLSTYNDLAAEKIALERASNALTVAAKAVQAQQAVDNAYTYAVEAVRSFQAAVRALETLPDYDELLGMVLAVEELGNEARGLYAVLERSRQLLDMCNDAAALLTSSVPDIDINGIESRLAIARAMGEAAARGEQLSNQLHLADAELAAAGSELAAIEAELAGINVCPLCNSVIRPGALTA